ncbi:MbtH family protein [Pseudomonas sp. CrR25]|nr:MbtH family protein [Pseudomonas sp. CrR25]
MIWDSPDTRVLVVVNDEEQCSIRTDYKQSGKEEYQPHIEPVWSVMRPVRLQALQAQGHS